jgi:hypothetical protein
MSLLPCSARFLFPADAHSGFWRFSSKIRTKVSFSVAAQSILINNTGAAQLAPLLPPSALIGCTAPWNLPTLSLLSCTSFCCRLSSPFLLVNHHHPFDDAMPQFRRNDGLGQSSRESQAEGGETGRKVGQKGKSGATRGATSTCPQRMC